MDAIKLKKYLAICPACGECRRIDAGGCPRCGQRMVAIRTERRVVFLGRLPREERLRYVRGEVPLRQRRSRKFRRRLYRKLPLRLPDESSLPKTVVVT